MFEGFSPSTIDFMINLRFNNEKPWFEAHKHEFLRDFLTPMKELGNDVFGLVTAEYGDRGFIHKVSRIYKDARRLHGGEPYRDHLWFSIEKPGDEWTSRPVFWFELSPESWSYGLGYYQARPETMAKFRARLDRDPGKFERLVAPLAKQDEFIMEGPEYARKKAAPTEKTALWYNKKSFSLTHYQQNGPELYDYTLKHRIAEGYLFLMPIYDYIITLDADPVPKGV